MAAPANREDDHYARQCAAVTVLAIVFWVCVGLLVYTHLGYPLLLALLARVRRARVVPGGTPALPTVSVIVAAYAEQGVIAARVANLRALEYPSERVEVIVACDGSPDATAQRAREAGADIVLELTPMAVQPVLDAVHAVRWGGRVVLAGLKGGRPVELPTDLLINKSLTVMGAFSVDSRAYAEAIRLIEAGRFPLERMHTHTFGLEDVPRAIETLAGEVPGEVAVHVAIMPGA